MLFFIWVSCIWDIGELRVGCSMTHLYGGVLCVVVVDGIFWARFFG
jgi:hypothetical protein